MMIVKWEVKEEVPTKEKRGEANPPQEKMEIVTSLK